MVTRVRSSQRIDDKITINLIRADADRLRGMAADQDISLSCIVREILSEYLARVDAETSPPGRHQPGTLSAAR